MQAKTALMRHSAVLLGLLTFGLLTLCWPAVSQDPADSKDQITFHSDVALARVDAQVVDSSNRAITHMHAEDFLVRVDGKPAPIRNFASEEMPLDVLFLLDVSASMRPHVQRIADASGQALQVLNKDDRMGIMVFDRVTHVRLSFFASRQDVQHEFDRLLRQERFNGGTDITRAMLDASDYIRRNGRQEARRAIVILTDDQTEFDRDEAAVSRSLARADAILCALIAPDAMAGRQGYPGGGQRRGGIGGGLGGIILGGPLGGPRGGGGYPGGGGGRTSTQSAGTSEIARDSGGDSMSVYDAGSLEDTLMRLRQRYALFFNMPEGSRAGDDRNITVDLTSDARSRFRDAEVRYRRAFQSGNHDRDRDDTPTLTRRRQTDPEYSTSSPSISSSSSGSSSDYSTSTKRRKRGPVNEDGSPIGSPSSDDSSSTTDAKPTPPTQQ